MEFDGVETLKRNEIRHICLQMLGAQIEVRVVHRQVEPVKKQFIWRFHLISWRILHQIYGDAIHQTLFFCTLCLDICSSICLINLRFQVCFCLAFMYCLFQKGIFFLKLFVSLFFTARLS